MPPQGLDMTAIREALQRRANAGGNVGGAGMPALSQMLASVGTSEVGGSNTPTTTPQPTPGAAMPNQQVPPRAAQAGAKVGQQAQSPLFDDQTRALGKALAKKLLDFI